MLAELTERVRETIQSAAEKLTGWRRRQFQAETAQKYCGGSPRRAERWFGWGRDAVRKGLAELQTGVRHEDRFAARGRKKSEVQQPQLAAAIHTLVEPQSQADPKFQTTFAYTRITAKAVREQLLAGSAESGLAVPAERTLRTILHRLNYRLRRIRKTAPQKKSQRPTPFSAMSRKLMSGRRAKRKPSAFLSTPRRK
jgi:hypothetical protein